MKYLLQARVPATPPLKPNAPRSKIQSETYRLFGVDLLSRSPGLVESTGASFNSVGGHLLPLAVVFFFEALLAASSTWFGGPSVQYSSIWNDSAIREVPQRTRIRERRR